MSSSSSSRRALCTAPQALQGWLELWLESTQRAGVCGRVWNEGPTSGCLFAHGVCKQSSSSSSSQSQRASSLFANAFLKHCLHS